MFSPAIHNPQSAILIVGPAWIGDMVMAQSLFKLLKSRQPEITIDVLAPDWSRPLLACMPEINQALISPFKHGEFNLIKRYQLAKQLQNREYDQAIVLPNSFKSALIPFLANIPKRTGWRGEMRWGLLNDVRYLDEEQYPLMFHHFLALGLAPKENLPNSLLFPTLQISPQKLEEILRKFQLEIGTQPILGICPGAEYGPSKRWPAEYFAEIAINKISEGWKVLLLGSSKDQTIAEHIQQASKNMCVDLTGKTTLEEAIYLLAATSAVVGNDSGLMHITAALHKPLVAIYGSTSSKFAPPLTTQAKKLSLDLACSPCFARECPLGHFRCMKDLKPTQVLAALRDLVP